MASWQPMTSSDLDAILNGTQQQPASADAPALQGSPSQLAAPDNPPLGRWDRFKMGVNSLVTGNDRTEFPAAPEFSRAFNDIPLGPDEPKPFDRTSARSETPREQGIDAIGGSAVTPDPQAQVDILKKAIPGLEQKIDAYGNVMLKAPGMTDFAYLNKPGFSGRDVGEFAAQNAITAPLLGPAGRFVSTAGKAIVGGLGLAGGSVAQDAAAMAQGSNQGIDEGRAAISGGLGAAIPVVGAGVRGLLGAGTSLVNGIKDTMQSTLDPSGVAKNVVQRAFAKDVRAGIDPARSALPSDAAIALGRNQDLRAMDYGGENVGREARKAANYSPSAKNDIMRVIGGRFEGQAQRGTDVVQNEMGLARSSDQVREDLANQARNARAPLYNQAFAAGQSGIDTPVLDQLQKSGTFQKAMGRAEYTLQDQNAMPGWRPWTAQSSPNGGPYTLAYWDQVKRNLDDYAGQAIRQGKNNEAAILTQMSQTLRGELDKAVPLYQQARGVAASFFNADNALEAGQNFATGNFNVQSAEQMVNRLNGPEKKLFAEGFADNLVQKIRSTPDRSSILNRIAQSPMEKDRIRIALGQQNYDQLDSFLRLEGVMDKMRNYMGNSTSAQQISDMLKGYGLQAGGAAAGAYGVYNGDPYTAIAGAIISGGKLAQLHINANVADEIGKLLTSKDPDVFLQGLQQIGKTPISDAIRAFDAAIGHAGIGVPMAVGTGVNSRSYQPQPGQ